ncbi:MAG: hypothetical protein ACYTFA_15395 [Planctomycetota bacterium]|jgi:hypothetical protein
MKTITAAMFAAALLLAGCDEDMRKDTSHTFYLDPDGAVTWMVLEKDIRSVAEDLQERREGEEELLAARRSGHHVIADALAMLDPLWVETRILREERPYMAATEARFASVDEVVQVFMDLSNAPVTAELRREDNQARLMILCDLEAPEDPEQEDGVENDDDEGELLMALVDDAEDYRLVLTDGEFTDTRGFRVEERGTVAILLEQSDEEIEAIEEVDEYGRTVVHSLTWALPHEE